MRWELMQADVFQDFDRARELPPAPDQKRASPVLFAVQADAGITPGWIAGPGEQSGPGEPVQPVAIASLADLETPDFWATVLRHHPRHPADLARYAHEHGPAPEVFLAALGLRSDYRTRDEWQGMGELDADTRDLARRYDFPFAVLRLWDRVNGDERRRWRMLFEERILKKNFIREIITDLYDLAPEQREQVLRAAEEFSAAWQARSGTFPGDRLRDIVRATRYPRLEENRRAVDEARSDLGALPRGVKLQLPPDLESTRLKLELEFDSAARLEEQLAFFSKERRLALQKILDLL